MSDTERDSLMDHFAHFLGRTYRHVERDDVGRETVSYHSGLDFHNVDVTLDRTGGKMVRVLGGMTLRLTVEVV